MNAAKQVVPVGPVDVAERQTETADDIGIKTFRMQHLRNVVNTRRVDGGDDGLFVDVAHQADLAFHVGWNRPIGTTHHGIRLNTDLAKRRHRMLRGLGLQLSRRADVGHQRNMQEEHVLAPHLVANLPGGFEKGQ